MTDRNTIFVTGGASGIGLAVVKAVLAEGWRAVVADLDAEALGRARSSLGAGDDQVRFEQLNVADEEAVVRTIAAVDSGFGPLTGVVNSAGIARDVPALETSTELFRRMLDVNVIGSFVVAREAARAMVARGAGAIVNLASVSGLKGNKGRVAYGASKGGVIIMTQVLAVELAPLGVRVNAIAPGPIDTPLVREIHTPDDRAAWTAIVPQRRYGVPEDIAAAAIFLLDGAKSGFLTGQTLAVDGGFSIAGIMTAPPAAAATGAGGSSPGIGTAAAGPA